jgi:hypothetical protein
MKMLTRKLESEQACWLWAKNIFDEWRFFHGFDTTKPIVNIFLNGDFIKDLADMLSSFVLQITKKDGTLYLPIKYYFLHFLNLFLLYKIFK